MDLIKQHLESIEGIEIYPIIAFIIFFVVFVVILVHSFSIKKKDLEAMKQIPLDEDDDNNYIN